MSGSDPSANDTVHSESVQSESVHSESVQLPRTHRRQPEEREQGVQPLAILMQRLQLSAHDLVSASPRQLTHKMVSRAVKGRWLTINSRRQVHEAFCLATGTSPLISELFNY
ncbi:MAG: hypothetical protein ACK5A3_21330 [Planctomyces sp.]|jgi:hypothetical protein